MGRFPKAFGGPAPRQVQQKINDALTRHGTLFKPKSINLPAWHLAIQRSGSGNHQRALWLDYDSGGMHGHRDALNLGLYGRGLDLLPDCGYPPLGFSGAWFKPKCNWYIATVGHNTVLVDRREQNVTGWKCLVDKNFISAYNSEIRAETTLWLDDEIVHGMRCHAAAYSQCTDYNRLAVMIDVDAEHYYILDIFRLSGGREHIKFLHSQFGELSTPNLNLHDAEEDFGPDAQMRHFQWDPAPPPNWQAEWTLDDPFNVVLPGPATRLRYHDLTRHATAGRCESWIAWGRQIMATEEVWIPRLMIRRTAEGDAPLTSCFAGILEPHAETPAIRKVRRLPLTNDLNVALEIELTNGRVDRIVSLDRPGAVALSRSHPADQEFSFTRE